MTHDLRGALASLDGFIALQGPALDGILAFVSTRAVRAGETIFCQGEPSPYCFGVLSGEIVIQHAAKDSRFPPKVLGLLGPGRLFGESSIFEDNPRAAMATAGKDGTLAVIRGQPLRAWLQKNPEAGYPLLLALLSSATERLEATSHELALVYGAGRILGSEKPFPEQLSLVLEFLKSSLPELSDLVFYRRSVYWDEFSPEISLPEVKELPAISAKNEWIQLIYEIGVPQALDVQALRKFWMDAGLAWEARAAAAVIPLFDWDKGGDSLQGMLLLASDKDSQAFSGDKQLLLASLSLPLCEALARYGRQEEAHAKERLNQSKDPLRP